MELGLCPRAGRDFDGGGAAGATVEADATDSGCGEVGVVAEELYGGACGAVLPLPFTGRWQFDASGKRELHFEVRRQRARSRATRSAYD